MAVTAARRIPGAAAAFAAVWMLASAVGDGWAADADRALFEYVRTRRGRTGTVIARVVSALAEPAVVYPVLAIAGAGAARRGVRGRRWGPQRSGAGRAAAGRGGWRQPCLPGRALARRCDRRLAVRRGVAAPDRPALTVRLLAGCGTGQ